MIILTSKIENELEKITTSLKVDLPARSNIMYIRTMCGAIVISFEIGRLRSRLTVEERKVVLAKVKKQFRKRKELLKNFIQLSKLLDQAKTNLKEYVNKHTTSTNALYTADIHSMYFDTVIDNQKISVANYPDETKYSFQSMTMKQIETITSRVMRVKRIKKTLERLVITRLSIQRELDSYKECTI